MLNVEKKKISDMQKLMILCFKNKYVNTVHNNISRFPRYTYVFNS